MHFSSGHNTPPTRVSELSRPRPAHSLANEILSREPANTCDGLKLKSHWGKAQYRPESLSREGPIGSCRLVFWKAGWAFWDLVPFCAMSFSFGLVETRLLKSPRGTMAGRPLRSFKWAVSKRHTKWEGQRRSVARVQARPQPPKKRRNRSFSGFRSSESSFCTAPHGQFCFCQILAN